MSTNFYLNGDQKPVDDDNPEFHIGKRYNAGGSDTGFIWAMHPEDAQRKVSETGEVVDEYGRTYTPEEFFGEIIRTCVKHEESIGQWFC